MKRRTITLTVLGAVFVIVVGVILYLQYRPEPEPEAEGEDPNRVKISRFDKDLIAEMTLENRYGTLKIWKDGDEWKVNYPFPVKLKESNIDDVAYSFASLYSEKVVEEEPEDIEKYGLKDPLATARYVLTDGSTREFYLGNKTPAGNTYYLMAEDDPKVYAVWMNHGSHFQYQLADLRETDVGGINPEELKYVKIARRGEKPIEIEKRQEVPEDEIQFTMGTWVITQPYRQPQAVDFDGFQQFSQGISTIRIQDYVEDDPSAVSLSDYGLDPPQAEFIVEDNENRVHLLFGKKEEDKIYFKEAEGTAIYTTRDYYTTFLDVDPLTLVDKFAFIVNIENVEEIRLKGLGKEYHLRIKRVEPVAEGEEPPALYYFNGEEVEEEPFKQLYQKIIEPQIDTDYQGNLAEKPEFQILYTFNKGEEREYRVSFVPYDVDFYALFRKGVSEFLVNRDQVKFLLDALDAFEKGTASG